MGNCQNCNSSPVRNQGCGENVRKVIHLLPIEDWLQKGQQRKRRNYSNCKHCKLCHVSIGGSGLHGLWHYGIRVIDNSVPSTTGLTKIKLRQERNKASDCRPIEKNSITVLQVVT